MTKTMRPTPEHRDGAFATKALPAACFLATLLLGCIETSKDVRSPVGDRNKNNQQTSGVLNPFTPGAPYFCPELAQYSAEARFCVKNGMALGPFTKKMVENCKLEQPKDVDCNAVNLPVALAAKWRGGGVCPAGSGLTSTGFCAEGNDVYGPFVHERVDVCKAQKGGPACETNRWSIAFATVASKAPDPVVVPPAQGEEAFERYIAPPIYTILREDKGTGYANVASAQHSRDLYYNGTKIFSVGTRRSHCVGITFQVLVMAMNLYYQDTKDARVWSMPAGSLKWEPFKNCWYVNSAEGRTCYGARDAIVRYGLGVGVKNFSELKIGDFVNYDRTSGYGHSVIFMGFVLPDGKITHTYQQNVVGFEYFSSQDYTDGPGKVKAYFEGESCPSTGDCGIIKNSLVMGRVLHPSKFVRQERLFSYSAEGSSSEVTVPLRYLLGNTKQK